jgi:tyrosyl-tRNA synthetase
VDLYHGEGAGEQAEAEFDRVFKDHAVPSDVEEREVPASELPTQWFRLLALVGLATSNKDARRKIEQGAVRLDQEKVTDPDQEATAADIDGRLISVGKRTWAKVRVGD